MDVSAMLIAGTLPGVGQIPGGLNRRLWADNSGAGRQGKRPGGPPLHGISHPRGTVYVVAPHAWRTTMGYKTILVHCDTGKPVTARLGVALELARRFDAHLVGVYVRPRFEAPIFADGSLAMDSLYRDYETRVKTDEATVVAAFTSALSGKDLS